MCNCAHVIVPVITVPVFWKSSYCEPTHWSPSLGSRENVEAQNHNDTVLKSNQIKLFGEVETKTDMVYKFTYSLQKVLMH